MTELAGALVGWQLGASAAAAVLLVRSWRRRAALNEALHELRRPMQALALVAVPVGQGKAVIDSSLRLATAALDRLELEINGGATSVGTREMVLVRPLLEVAVERWRSRASVSGASVRLRHGAAGAIVEGERILLSQAIDNLIVNAIEHGGSSIVVEAVARGGRLRISVADSGRASRPAARRGNPAEVLARLAGRRRRGHGLSVVRRVASSHGGRFALQRSAEGARAVLELPLATGDEPSS